MEGIFGKLLMNYTTIEELECFLLIQEESTNRTDVPFCPRTWDSLLCWPPTEAGTRAELPCFSELNGVKYNTSQNASRWCLLNHTWDNYTDYTMCKVIRSKDMLDFQPGIEITTMIYFGGYTMSMIALSIAIYIFLYFKDLHCLRNTIHTNLMCTFMMADFMWILTITLQMSSQGSMTSCIMLIIMLHYFHLTNFFWMFIEGLYLYILVVETFNRENIKLIAYVFIGWGMPVLIIMVWGIAMSLAEGIPDNQNDSVLRHCPWMTPHIYDWIFQTPALLVLAINLIFLMMIMWVLITKLRSANTVETQQYRKATKALLVLIPLLGITYILVIAGPTEGLSANIYAYIRAILLSTQGFTVALFYCFLNTDVQNAVRNRVERWKASRDLSGGRSPNARAENLQIYGRELNPSQSNHPVNKRESTTSSTATMTLCKTSSITTSFSCGKMSNSSSTRGYPSRTPVSPNLDPNQGDSSV